MSFLLAKWYLDCVDDEGQVFIGYWASLAFRGHALRYSSVIERRRDEDVRSRRSLGRALEPKIENGIIRWTSRKLGFDGAWAPRSKPFDEVLLETEKGRVQWSCVAPSARVEIRRERGAILRGFGYAEKLVLSMAPWRLPLNELRWGRFLSPTDAIVWIDWRGERERRVAYHNGARVPLADVTDCRVALGDSVLAIHDNAVLREGRLGSTVLARIPLLERLLPARALAMHECKWLGRGALRGKADEGATGWTIHEVVRWG